MLSPAYLIYISCGIICWVLWLFLIGFTAYRLRTFFTRYLVAAWLLGALFVNSIYDPNHPTRSQETVILMDAINSLLLSIVAAWLFVKHVLPKREPPAVEEPEA